MTTAAANFWSFLAPPSDAMRAEVRQLAVDADARRLRADYATGSILESEALALWALAEFVKARVVIEVGTFIGTSTTALAMGSHVESVFTCDISNDCLPSFGVVRTYPKQSSTQMLRDVKRRGVRADLCFFDGVLSPTDADLVTEVTHDRTVFAFHDFNFGPKQRTARGVTYLETVPRKGIGNVNLLKPRLWKHTLVQPQPDTTLALLVPEAGL